jgi:hypothetical protein
LQHALQNAQMILEMLVLAVGRVTVDHGWWISRSKGPVVADQGPEPGFAGSTKAGLQHWYDCIIGMHSLTSHHVPGYGIDQRADQGRNLPTMSGKVDRLRSISSGA